MKTTITTLICIISILSFGQVKLHNENEGLLYQVMPEKFDTLYIDTTNDSGLFIKGKRLYYWNADSLKWLSLNYSYNQQDTISVIMLVCDTSKQMSQSMIKNFKETNSLNIAYTTLQNVYWIKGYEVFEKHNSVEWQVIYNTKDFYEYKVFKEYLDENKKKLSGNIIVWQSK